MNRTILLGELIAKLERIPYNSSHVYFDFVSAFPVSINSWRGVYADLALGWSRYGLQMFAGGFGGERKDAEPMTIQQFIVMLKDCIGKTYEGYKGGSYKMDLKTEVWVDNWGEATCTAIVDIEQVGDYRTILRTEHRD